MAQIVPAILEETKEGFLDKVSRMARLPGVERIQVDFADGVFVPRRLLPVSEIDSLSPAIHWEAHLMVRAPEDFLDYHICGFKTIVLHYEAFADASGLERAVASVKHVGMEPGICVNSETPVSVLERFWPEVKHFQVMGVEPGFQGSPFIESTPGRLKALRELLPHAILEIDGGVGLSNIKMLAHAGADLLIAGSALTQAPDMQKAYEQLVAEIHKLN